MIRSIILTLVTGLVSIDSQTTAADAQSVAQETKVNRWEASAEKKYKMTIEATQGAKRCHSRTSIEYQQRGDIALVNGEVTVESCTVATGEYTISLRLKDDSGEIRNLEFVNTWRKNDAAPVEFANEYSIGDNVDLIRVRARRTQCICEDAETDTSSNRAEQSDTENLEEEK